MEFFWFSAILVTVWSRLFYSVETNSHSLYIPNCVLDPKIPRGVINKAMRGASRAFAQCPPKVESWFGRFKVSGVGLSGDPESEVTCQQSNAPIDNI